MRSALRAPHPAPAGRIACQPAAASPRCRFISAGPPAAGALRSATRLQPAAPSTLFHSGATCPLAAGGSAAGVAGRVRRNRAGSRGGPRGTDYLSSDGWAVSAPAPEAALAPRPVAFSLTRLGGSLILSVAQNAPPPRAPAYRSSRIYACTPILRSSGLACFFFPSSGPGNLLSPSCWQPCSGWILVCIIYLSVAYIPKANGPARRPAACAPKHSASAS